MFNTNPKYRFQMDRLREISNTIPISSQNFGKVLQLKNELEPLYIINKPSEPIDYQLLLTWAMPFLILLAYGIIFIRYIMEHWFRRAHTQLASAPVSMGTNNPLDR